VARAPAVQIQCDRCKRVVTLAASAVKRAEGEPVLTVRFDGKELKFDDLCPPCHQAVERMIEDLKEWDRKIKQPFLGQGPAVPSGVAAPVQSAPTYSPPKPHAAGSSR
jgi:cytochrome c5